MRAKQSPSLGIEAPVPSPEMARGFAALPHSQTCAALEDVSAASGGFRIALKSLPRLVVLAGPAGIGKTRFLLENFSRLVHESPDPFHRDVIYLIPTAEHRERLIDLMLRKEKGFFGERVTTLNRLMQELLKAGDFSMATDVERRFFLSEIVAAEGGEYFSAVREFPGFLEKMSGFVGELKESLVSLERFKKAMVRLQKARPGMAEKYAGLSRIYEAYESRLESLGLRDHRDGLFLLKETESKKTCELPRFRHLFVDGFFDFSPSQFEFLRWLSGRSEKVTLALTLDLSEERRDLFRIPRETLKEMETLGFQTVDLSSSTNYRGLSEPLRHIEKNLFANPLTLNPLPQRGRGEDGGQSVPPVSILEATGMRGEVEMIAREIRRMMRGGAPAWAPDTAPVPGGHIGPPLHFSDIAVILRRVGDYEEVIRAVFREFQIPVEIHERERLRDTPLARTITSFFKILLEDWKREDLFNFLKSSSPPGDYPEICALEIQGLDAGIASGRERWLKDVPSPLFDFLCSFQDRFRAAGKIEEWIRITEEAIASFGLSRIPVAYEEEARRDFASIRRLKSLLEEVRLTHAGWEGPAGTFERFAQELLRLIDVDLFSLHDRDKNRVQVYDVSLARQKEYRVVFLAGLLEKYFPVEIREDPILSDEERREVGLQERLPRQAVERYFFYLGLTRAKEKIVLSYPRFDLEGREALPSFYVDEVERLFTGPIPKQSYSAAQTVPRPEDAVEEREVEAYLVQCLFDRTRAANRADRAFAISLYNRMVERPSFQTRLARVLFEPVAQIESGEVRAAFLPKGGIFKPTGLEIYGRCPYRYFASQVLRLEEKEEGIDPRQVGILLHDCLEHYWRERVEKGRRELEDLFQAKTFVREHLDQLLQKNPLRGDKAYRLKLKRRQMETWLEGMVAKEIETGAPLAGLRPRHFEFEFGFSAKGGSPPASWRAGASGGKPKEVGYLKLYDPYREDLLLRGKIDRVDVDASGTFGLVIDYKTGSTFKSKDLESGTALQLPLYILAIQQHLKLKPVGGEIYQITTAESRGFYSKEALAETGIQTRSRSVLEKKEFDKVLERAVRFSRKFSEGITQAQIPVRPRDCDPHCPFPSVCRIEKWRLPFIYQEIHEEDKKNGMV